MTSLDIAPTPGKYRHGVESRKPMTPPDLDGLGAVALDRVILEELFTATYEELRRLASSIRRGDPSTTLSPTALVNEAWLKLAGSPPLASVSRVHFKRIAARAMRQVLIEAARRRNAHQVVQNLSLEPRGRAQPACRHLLCR